MNTTRYAAFAAIAASLALAACNQPSEEAQERMDEEVATAEENADAMTVAEEEAAAENGATMEAAEAEEASSGEEVVVEE